MSGGCHHREYHLSEFIEVASPTTIRGDYEPGAVVAGRFRIECLLGVGGMSSVYRVFDEAFERTVALKMLHPHVVRERSSLERFLQEARAEERLKHPNIVGAYSVGVTDDGKLYMVMDYLQGESLSATIERSNSIPESQAIGIFLQICAGLEIAHANNVVHRDLKPSNIMLVTNAPDKNSVKIVDFGIARLLGNEDKLEGQRLTKAGSVLGSPAYMSPEQCRGEELDARSDIYSLGCLMYEALTGISPFECDSELETMCRHLNEMPMPFRQAAPNVVLSDGIEKIVFHCLEKDVHDRYQSVTEIAADLRALQNHEPIAASEIPRKKVTARAKIPTSTVAIAGVFLFGALAIFVGVRYQDTLAIWYTESLIGLEHSPQRSAELRRELAHLYDKQGLTDKALAYYQESVQHADAWPNVGDRIDAQIDLAKSLRKCNRTAASAQAFAKTLADLIALTQVNQIRTDDVRITQTAREIEQLMTKRSANELLLGLAGAMNSHFDVARQLVRIVDENASAKEKESSKLLLGTIFCKEHNPTEARRIFNDLIDNAPEELRTSLAYASGSAFYSNGLYDDALNVFCNGLAAKPKSDYDSSDADVMRFIGHIYLKKNKPSSAVTYFRDASRLGSDNKLRISILRTLGETEYSLGNFAASESAFREQLQLMDLEAKPDQQEYAIALNHLGESLAIQKKYQPAYDSFKSAISICTEVGNYPLAREISGKLQQALWHLRSSALTSKH